MSTFFNNIANIGRKVNRLDPIDRAVQNFTLGKPNAGRNYYGEGPLPPPGPPTQDVAANAAQQQQDILRKRRGVLSNIYAGGAAGAPDVASKSQLGS